MIALPSHSPASWFLFCRFRSAPRLRLTSKCFSMLQCVSTKTPILYLDRGFPGDGDKEFCTLQKMHRCACGSINPSNFLPILFLFPLFFHNPDLFISFMNLFSVKRGKNTWDRPRSRPPYELCCFSPFRFDVVIWWCVILCSPSLMDPGAKGYTIWRGCCPLFLGIIKAKISFCGLNSILPFWLWSAWTQVLSLFLPSFDGN